VATTMISVVFEDVEGLRWREPIYFDVGDVDTVAKAQTQLGKYETLLENLSGCAIVEAQVTFNLTVDTGQSPDVGYSIRSGAYLSFRNSDSVGDGIYIPGILGNKISNDVIIDSETNVAAFIAAASGSGANSEEPLSTRGSGSLWATYLKGKGASRKVK